jgi:capsid protein
MGLIEKIFPKAVKKAADKVASKQVNSFVSSIKSYFSGGSYGRGFYSDGSAGGAKWSYGLSASGRTKIIDHRELRQNARDAYSESMEARGIINRLADNIVDTGLVLEATPEVNILGITPEEGETWAADVKRRHNLWAQSKKQHRSGTLNFYQAQRLYEISQQRDNDIFVRFYYSNKRDLQNPLQYEFIDPNQIRGYALTTTDIQYFCEDGIVRNPDGTEKAYKVWIKDPKNDGQYKDVTIPRIGEKSKRIMMIHGFSPEYPGQGRGFSLIGFAIQELENITDFSSAIIKKAINQSNLILSVENQQQDPGNAFEPVIQDRSTSAIGVPATEASQEIINELSRDVKVCPLPEAGLDTPGSTMVLGNEQGDIVKLLDTKAPADNFKEFISTFTERLAAAAGIPQEVVLMKFSNNYSASRATLILFWKVVQIWRMEMATDFLNPSYESWLSGEIAAGRIFAPGFADPVLKAAWLSCKWMGTSLPNIDPGKDAKARMDNLEMNLTTLEREARDLNGSDIKTNIEKNKKTFEDLPKPPWSGSAIAEEQQSGNNGDEDVES